MKSYRLPAVLTIGAAVLFAWGCDSANPDVAATAGGEQLTAAKLGEIIGNSQGPLEKDFARTLAELWVNYQLAGEAAAKNDSITDPKDMDYGLWSFIEGMRTKKFGEEISKSMKPVDNGCDAECLYNKGNVVLSARHILVAASDGTQPSAGPAVSPEQREVAKKKAEAIRAQATPANFNSLTAKSDEPGAAERKGDLGTFAPVGQMVQEFTNGVLKTKPGEVSEVVPSAFGYHIIYRPTYAEVKDKVDPQLAAHPMQAAESTYVARLDSTANIKVDKNAPVTVRAVARNPLAYANDNTVLAEYKGGKFTLSRLADVLNAYPPQQQVRQQIVRPEVPDSAIIGLVKVFVRNQLIVNQADSAKVVLDTAEMANLHMGFRTNLTGAWTQMGIDPKILADSAKSEGDRLKVAGRLVNSYFDKLVANQVAFADIAYPVVRTLQKKYKFTVNDAGLERALEKAKGVRGSADSLRAKQGPPTPGAAPAGPPPADKE